MNARRSPLSRLRAAAGSRQTEGSGALVGAAATGGRGAPARATLLWASFALLGAVALLLFTSAPALAATPPKLVAEIDGSDTPAVEAGGNFAPYGGVAAAPGGDIWVSDSGSGVVDKLSSAGAYLGQLSGAPAGFSPSFPAVDPTSGDLYVIDQHPTPEKLDKFSPAGAFLEEVALETPVSGVAAIAVNSSGDVYVALAHKVARFSPTGELLAEFSHGAGFAPVSLAIAPNGDVYAADTENSVVDRFSEAGAFISQNDGSATPAGSFGGAFSLFAIAVDPASGELYAGDNEHAVVDEFSDAGAYEAQFDGAETEAGAFSFIYSLAADGEGDVYVANPENLAAGSENGLIYEFGPSGPAEYPLTITKSGSGSGTVTSTPAGIDCGTTCTVEFEEGETVELEAEEEAGSEFTGWTTLAGDPGTCVGTTSPCEVTMSEAIELEAGFEPEAVVGEFLFNVQGGGNGHGTVGCEVEGGPSEPCPTTPTNYPEGSEIVLTATHGANSSFAGFSGGGCSTSPCTLTLAANTTVTATFTQNTQTLTVVPTGSGSVGGGPISGCSEGGGTCSGPADEGSTVHLIATPGANQHVTWTSGCTNSSGNTCEVAIGASAATVHAAFAQNTQTLTVVPTGSGSVGGGPISGCSEGGGTCSGPADEGSTVHLIATPGANQHVTWTSGCTNSSGNTCEVAIGASAATVHAAFAQNTRTLTINTAGGTGTGTVSCDGGACSPSYPEGEVVILKAEPGTHASFGGWSVTGAAATTCAGAVAECTVEFGIANVTVGAPFTLNQRTLTLAKAGSGSGPVTSAPAGIDCGTACSAVFSEGATVTLTAAPAAHTTVAWSGCATASGDSCTVVIGSTDASVTATFTVRTDVLTITRSGSGSGTVASFPVGIDCGTACSASFAEGSTVTITATPAAGSEFVGWSGGGCTGTAPCQLTLVEATAVTAQFRVVPPPPSCATDPSLCPPAEPGKPKVSASAPVKGGIASLKVSCRGSGGCKGTLKLTARLKIGKKTKTVVVGTAHYNVAAGKSKTIKVKITNGQVKKLLNQGRTVKAKLGGKSLAGTVKLKPAGKGK